MSELIRTFIVVSGRSVIVYRHFGPVLQLSLAQWRGAAHIRLSRARLEDVGESLTSFRIFR